MPAISFSPEFLDAILRGDKCQTTRRLTDRFEEGDTVNAYIQQRKAIASKPLRELTETGHSEMLRMRGIAKKNYPPVPPMPGMLYPAHFLGRFSVKEIYELHPLKQSPEELEFWAELDGFYNFHRADRWFSAHHSADWMDFDYTVIRWDGLFDRYFDPLVVSECP